MRTILLTVVALSLSLANCSKTDEPAASGSKAAGGSDVIAAKAAAGTANGRCPVLVDEMVDKNAPSRMYKDPKTGIEQKIGFCCDKCPKKFDKDPEQYMGRMRADPAKFGYTLP